MAHSDVAFHRLAHREYEAAQGWYARFSEETAVRFRVAVEAAVERIAEAPHRWPTFRRHYRHVRAGRFPYSLYYRVLDPEHVLVLAVAHASRRPGYWVRRK